MATIDQIAEATKEFYDLTVTPTFSKSLKLNKVGERRLLPLYGAFLFGKFGRVDREVRAKLGKSANARIDFQVGNTAIELAVRKPRAPKSGLSKSVNRDEIEKLLRHNGLSALVLLDYSRSPFTSEELENFRNWPSLGKGNHNLTPFNVIYCYRSEGHTSIIKKNIRL